MNNNNYKDQPKKELNIKHLKYLFGDVSENILNKLQYDHISIYSITPAKLATDITTKLQFYSIKIFGSGLVPGLDKSINKLIITEMTACIGGNVISFAKNFKYVNAIELCKKRYDFLNHNLQILNINANVNTINGDSLIEIVNLKQDIIFFDIPWGGRNYKFKEKINLYISKIPSYEACNLVKRYTKIIVMKIPNNFNLEKFTKCVNMIIFDICDFIKFKLIILI